MSKIKYLIKRIFSLDFNNMFKTINKVHKETKKLRIFIFFDMVYCGFKYQAGYMDYYRFRMFELDKKIKKIVLTRGKNNELVKELNDPQYIPFFSNKAVFNKKFNKYLNREYLLINNDNYNLFEKFICNKKDIIVKPLGLCCGKGIEKIHIKDYDKKELYSYLINTNRPLIEEVATQHKIINNIYPNAINTIRVVTIIGNSGVTTIVAAYLRMGTGKSIVDNFNNGGICCPIDINTGIINYPAVNKECIYFDRHPDTSFELIGFKIPNWDLIINLAKEASKVVKEVRYIGWDICLQENKPFLIEGNEFPSYDLYQIPKEHIGTYDNFLKAIKK